MGFPHILPPPKQHKKQKFDPIFLEERRKGLQKKISILKRVELSKYLKYLKDIRPLIFGSKHTASSFVKFIYPMVN